MRLCPLKGTSDAAERSSLSEGCFAKYTLTMSNGQNKLWLYRGAPGDLAKSPNHCTFRPQILTPHNAAMHCFSSPTAATLACFCAGSSYFVSSHWRLPAGVRCARCVLQWRYMTGHQC